MKKQLMAGLGWGGACLLACTILGVSLLEASADTLDRLAEASGGAVRKEAAEGTAADSVQSHPGAPTEATASLVPAADERSTGAALLTTYALPYPGILPDHPLYFAKMIRDRVRLFFTHQSVQRAELLIHYANKRLAASCLLVDEGELAQAAQAAQKAEAYLLQAARLATKNQTKPVLLLLSQATKDHAALLDWLEQALGDDRGFLAPARRDCQTARQLIS